jgi:hypothetical protein
MDSLIMELLDSVSDPVKDTEQHTEMVCGLQGGGFNIGVCIWRWMEVCLRYSRLGVVVPPTLPDIVFSRFEIMNSVVTPLEPPNIETCLHNRPRILVVLKVKGEPPR